MDSVVEKLRKDIEELERQIEAHPFGSLFDKKRSDQLYQKLKKKRKELAKSEGSGSPGSDVGAETPPASQDTAKRKTPGTKPRARKTVEKNAPASGTKAKAGARGKGKTSTAAQSKPKASAGGAKVGSTPAPRKAATATKGKAKSSRAAPAHKSSTLTKKGN